MYKEVAKKVLAVVLSLCMVLGMTDFSTLTVRAGGTLSKNNVTQSKFFFVYNGADQAPTVTINGTSFEKGNVGNGDYTISWPSEMKNVGTKTITITGNGTYSGTVEVEYYIVQKSIESDTIKIEIASQQYTGSAIVPKMGADGVQITDTEVEENSGNGTLTAADFTYTCENNINAGEETAIMNITGSGNYTGSTSKKFSIHKKKFDVDAILEEIADQVYDGTVGKEYKPTLTFKDSGGSPLDLKEGKDYRVVYTCEPGKNLTMPGIVNVTVTGIGDYENSKITDSYKITKNMLTYGAGITINGTGTTSIPAQYYTGSDIEPITGVYDNGFKLEYGVDYTLIYEDNKNAGTAYVMINFQGCYSGNKSVNFKIQAGDLGTLDGIKITVADCTYTGVAQEPEPQVTFHGNVMTKGTDYDVSYRDNEDVGTATVIITGKGNLKGSAEETFEITPIQLTSDNITVENAAYDGTEQKPIVTVRYNGQTLTSSKDYEVIGYQNNIYAGTATVTVRGKGNYTGRVTQTFKIDQLDVTTFETEKISVTGNISTGSFSYTGSAIKPDVSTIVYKGFTLVKNTDFTIVSYENNTNVTEKGKSAYVVVETKGNYKGQLKLPFTITAVDIEKAVEDGWVTWTLPGTKASDGFYHYTYNFAAQNPKVTLKYKASSGASQVTVSEADYEVQELSSGDVGKKTITITGTGNFINSFTIDFYIDQLDIESLSTDDFSIVGLKDAYYLGIDGSGEVIPVDPSDELLSMYYKDTNPITGRFIKAINNEAPGEGKLIFEANGNFKGTITKPFTIKCNLTDASIKITDMVEKRYTGSEVELAEDEVEVYFGNTKLNTTDYTLSYKYTDGWVGETTVSLVPAGKYCYMDEGDVSPTATFNIKPQNIGKAELKSEESKVYTGSAIVPGITYGKTTLVEGTHYTVAAQAEDVNDTNVGEAQVTLQGCTPYFESTSSTKIEYEILQRDISGGTITFPATVTYEDLKDAVAALQFHLEDTEDADIDFGIGTDANYTMVKETDYKVNVTYTDSSADVDPIGNAKLTITGIGNFKGEVSCNFLIQGDLSQVTFEIDSITYTGNNIELDKFITVEYDRTLPEGTEKELVFGKDYTLEYADSCNVANEIAFTIKPVDNRYINSKASTFSIGPKSITTREDEQEIQAEYINVDWGEFYYNFGKDVQPSITVTDTERLEDAQTLIKDTDYKIQITYDEENSKEAGASINVTITGMGNYTGSITKTFEIKPLSLNAKNADNTDKVKVTYQGTEGQVPIPETVDYTDAEIVFEGLQVTYEGATLPLEVEKDYSFEYKDNKLVGTATITITGSGNYTDDKIVSFKIIGNLSDKTEGAVVVRPVEDQLYTMGGAEPEITVVYYGEELPKEYYTIEYTNNEAVGTATAKLVGDGEFCRGEISTTFEVVKRDLSENPEDGIFIEPKEEYIYNGKAIIPEAGDFILTKNGKPVKTELYSYEIVGYGENTNAAAKEEENAAYVEIAIVRKDGADCYTGTMNVRFTINPMPLTKSMITVEDTVYNGSALEPQVTVAYKNAEGETITLSAEDYKLSWKNNTDAAKSSDSEAPTVTVEGTGNYGGKVEVPFTIEPWEMVIDESAEAKFQVVIAPQTYSGEVLVPDPVVKDPAGKVLEKDKDYTVSAGTNNIDANKDKETKATITIKGINNYAGTITPKFTINPKYITDEKEFVISGIVDKVYNSKKQTQQPTITWGEKVLTLNKDYTITCKDVKVGAATAVIRGIGNYDGSRTVNFKITRRSLSDKGIVIKDIANQVYTGNALTPIPEIYYEDAEQGINTKLVYGTDYTVTYQNHTKVGVNIATVKITGKGNYCGTASTTFTIVGSIALASVRSIPVQNYTGKAIEPKPVVTQAGKTLVEGTDYSLSYSNNVEAGTATITIKGMNEYGGTKKVKFTICRDISGGLEVVGLGQKYLYTGKAIVPTLGKVSAYGKVLTLDKDYKVTVTNNVDVDTATLKVEGIGAYKGSKTYNFDIVRRSISQCSVSAISTQNYTGKALIPAITIKYNNKKLTLGTDYTLVYQNNTMPGTASIIIKGKGNLNGSKIVTFKIKMADISNAKAAAAGTDKIKVSWKKQSTVTGYQIYDEQNKKVAQIKGSSNTSYTITGLKAGTTYKYKVRAYVIKNGRTCYSAFTSLMKTSTKPKTPSITVKSSKSKQAVISWKKVSGASGYEIYRSTKKSSGYKKIAATTKVTYTNTKLTANKKYYYKVRAYRTVDGKKIYSSYSSVKYVTIKK